MKALKKMTGHTRLYRRGAVYYHRASIPNDIKDTYGKAEETFSLRTKDHAEALRLVRLAAVKVDGLFEEHRRHQRAMEGPKLDALTKEQLQRIRETYYHHLLDEDDDIRDQGFEPSGWDASKQGPPKLFRGQSFKEYSSLNKEMRQVTEDSLSKSEDEAEFFRGEAEEVLTWEGIGLRLKQNSKSWPRLIRTLQEAYLEASKGIKKRSKGKVVVTPDAPSATSITPSRSPLLSKVIDDWIAEKEREKAWTTKTREDYKHWAGVFLEICGDKPIAQYNKDSARALKAALLRLPSNWRKHSATRDHNITKAIEIGEANGLEPLSTATVTKAMNRVGFLWQWIEVHHDNVTSGLFKGMRLKSAEGAAEQRNPFSTKQLQTLFDSPLYTGCKSQRERSATGITNMGRTAWFWLPLLGLFSGARLNELCQLHVSCLLYTSPSPRDRG